LLLVYSSIDLNFVVLSKFFSTDLQHYLPKSTIEWEDLSEKHCLNEIMDIDDWHLFAQAKGFPYRKGDLQGFVKLLRGNPKTIFDALEAEAPTWRKYE